MNKLSKALLYLTIFCAVGAGIFISEAKSQAKAAECYRPFLFIDETDKMYNHAVCEGNFQVYFFPVVADGRKYTITLHSIDGKQKLFASRYKNKVDNLNSILSWTCTQPSCDSATQISEKTKIVNFRAPSGESEYYSWFAVYGTTASNYQIGVSNNGVLQYLTTGEYIPDNGSGTGNTQNTGNTNTGSTTTNNNSGSTTLTTAPTVSWVANLPTTNFNTSNVSWTAIAYDDSSWINISLPDKGPWNCDNCYRQYRGTFNLSSVPSNLKMKVTSDDGLWVYLNGQFIGQWGSDNPNTLMCVNHYGCTKRVSVPDIGLNNLVQGENVISVVVVDGGDKEFFDAELKI